MFIRVTYVNKLKKPFEFRVGYGVRAYMNARPEEVEVYYSSLSKEEPKPIIPPKVNPRTNKPYNEGWWTRRYAHIFEEILDLNELFKTQPAEAFRLLQEGLFSAQTSLSQDIRNSGHDHAEFGTYKSQW